MADRQEPQVGPREPRFGFNCKVGFILLVGGLGTACYFGLINRESFWHPDNLMEYERLFEYAVEVLYEVADYMFGFRIDILALLAANLLRRRPRGGNGNNPENGDRTGQEGGHPPP